jgi:hypothetical protein
MNGLKPSLCSKTAESKPEMKNLKRDVMINLTTTCPNGNIELDMIDRSDKKL